MIAELLTLMQEVGRRRFEKCGSNPSCASVVLAVDPSWSTPEEVL